MITSTAISKGGLGRFGNQLFTIAGVIGTATKSGQPFGFGEWKNYDNALFGSPVDNLRDVFVNPLPDDRNLTFEEYGYFWGYRDIKLTDGNWSINAHMQSPKFFQHCIDEVRHYFKMKDEPKQNDYVSVHYRAGDYIDDVRAYHPRQPFEYYEKAMSLFPGETFKIYSDNMEDAKRVFDRMVNGLKDRIIYCSSPDYLTDFKYMKKCKSFIIANSSFSAMAAHLGEHPEKKVVAPKLWFGSQANGMETKDIYSPDWIVI